MKDLIIEAQANVLKQRQSMIQDLQGTVIVYEHVIHEYAEKVATLENDLEHFEETTKELHDAVQHWQDLYNKERRACEEAGRNWDEALLSRNKADRQRDKWMKRAKQLEARCEDLMAGLDPATHEARGDTIEYLTDTLEYVYEAMMCDNASAATDILIKWRNGDPMPAREDWLPRKYMVYVVDAPGDPKVFTGSFADYDKARESVDLMVERGVYEAWVEELDA